MLWLYVVSPLAILMGIGAILCLAVGAGVNATAETDTEQGTLDCFHCGHQTSTGRKVCEHCGEELQS